MLIVEIKRSEPFEKGQVFSEVSRSFSHWYLKKIQSFEVQFQQVYRSCLDSCLPNLQNSCAGNKTSLQRKKCYVFLFRNGGSGSEILIS